MSAPSYTGSVLRKGQRVMKRVAIADIALSTMAIEVVQAPPPGYANVVTRFVATIYAAGLAVSDAGSDDNLVLRATDASGAIQTQPILGDAFLETAITGFATRVALPKEVQFVVAGAALVLAYSASADGVTTTSATGYLDVSVEYDIVYVGQ